MASIAAENLGGKKFILFFDVFSTFSKVMIFVPNKVVSKTYAFALNILVVNGFSTGYEHDLTNCNKKFRAHYVQNSFGSN
jgi:hypothetical protein